MPETNISTKNQATKDTIQQISYLSQQISYLSQQIPCLSQQIPCLSQQIPCLSQQIPCLSLCNTMIYKVKNAPKTYKTIKTKKTTTTACANMKLQLL